MKEKTIFLGCSVCVILVVLVLVIVIKRRQNSPEKKMRKMLAERRKESAQLQYRKNCAALFEKLSCGIQNLLAQEERDCPGDKVFCKRLSMIIENESMDYLINNQKSQPTPLPLTEEEKLADLEMLEELIRVEAEKNPPLKFDIPWEKIVEEVVPVLRTLMDASVKEDAEICRNGLRELKTILQNYHIYVTYYSEELAQKYPETEQDFMEEGPYAIPVMYYVNGTNRVRMGESGRMKKK